MESGKPKNSEGILARREKKLAFLLLSPTFLLVVGIVLFPLFANFWISFKPISLADLRPPTILVDDTEIPIFPRIIGISAVCNNANQLSVGLGIGT